MEENLTDILLESVQRDNQIIEDVDIVGEENVN